jgi:hypothetical protein
MWYLKCGVFLTKYNLARRHWNGCKQCVFCSQSKTIQHLFFVCHFARFIWRAVQVSFNIDIPTSVEHLYTDWANGVGNRFKKLILVGVVALCWALWTGRNDMMFDNSPANTYKQILF